MESIFALVILAYWQEHTSLSALLVLHPTLVSDEVGCEFNVIDCHGKWLTERANNQHVSSHFPCLFFNSICWGKNLGRYLSCTSIYWYRFFPFFFFSRALFLILEVLLPNSALGGLYNHSHKKKKYLLWFRTYSYWLVLMTYFLHRLLMFLKISWKSRKKLQPNFLVKIKVGGMEMLLWDPLLDGVRKCFPLCMCGVCMCVPHKFCLVFSQSSGFFNFLFWVVIPVVSESKFHHLFYFFLKFLIIQTSYF